MKTYSHQPRLLLRMVFALNSVNIARQGLSRRNRGMPSEFGMNLPESEKNGLHKATFKHASGRETISF